MNDAMIGMIGTIGIHAQGVLCVLQMASGSILWLDKMNVLRNVNQAEDMKILIDIINILNQSIHHIFHLYRHELNLTLIENSRL